MITGAARFGMGLRGLLVAMAVFGSGAVLMALPWAIAEGVPEDERPELVGYVAVMAVMAVCGIALFSWAASPRSWWVTFRYACFEAFSYGFLWLALSLVFVPKAAGMPPAHIMVMLVVAALACVAACIGTHDGMARWRRRRALRLLMSAPTYGRPHVSVGRVEDSVSAGRWMRMMQVGYVPNGSEPYRFWTLGWNDPPTLMLVTHDPSRPGAVRDVVSVSADVLREHGWDFS